MPFRPEEPGRINVCVEEDVRRAPSLEFTLDKHRNDLFFGRSVVAIKHNWYDEIDPFLGVDANDRCTTAKSHPGEVDVHVVSGLNKMCEPN